MILAREILSGDRLGALDITNLASLIAPVESLAAPVYLFGLLVRSVAWLGDDVGVIDHMGGRWTFRPDDLVRCLQRWNGSVPS